MSFELEIKLNFMILNKSTLKSLLVVLSLIVLSGSMTAEGSKDLYPDGVQGGRAYLRASVDTRLPIPFPTLGTHYVFVNEGEQIALASSAQQDTSNTRIKLYGPNGTEINLNYSGAAGNIANRAAELAGPRLPNQPTGGNRYEAIYHIAAVTGIYRVEFIGTSDSTTGNERMNYILANANWTQASDSNYLAAWDISVAKNDQNSWSWVNGRVYTQVLNMDNPAYIRGNNGNSYFHDNAGFFGKFKVLTRDGYVYNVDNNGNYGMTFTFMVNNRGFHALDNPNQPLYKSIETPEDFDVSTRYHDPRTADDGASVTHKIFYNLPDGSMPETSVGAVPGASTWLRPIEENLSVDAITLEGVEGTENQLSKKGAYIKFDNESGGDYTIRIKPNPNSNSNFQERIITGPSEIGENNVFWDGKDGNDEFLPAGFADVLIELKLKGAEVHFPYIDMELNPNGVIIELLTQDLTQVRSDRVYWDDSDMSTNVYGGTSNPRNASHFSNPSGESSSTNGHKWGADTNRAKGTFGDERGMDTWTFIEGDTYTEELEVSVNTADLEIVSIIPDQPIINTKDTSTFVYSIKVKNNGPSDVQGAPFSFYIPEGFTPGQVEFVGNNCGTEALNLVYDEQTREYKSVLDLPNECEVEYKITLNVHDATGNNEFYATILRPNDTTDPDATNPDVNVPPTDPFYECENNGLNIDCNNIEYSGVEVTCYDSIDVIGESFDWLYVDGATQEETVSETMVQPGANAGFVFDIYELDNSFNMNINGTLLATEEIEFLVSGTSGQNVRFADGDIWEQNGIPSIWQLRGVEGKPILRIKISSEGVVTAYGSKFSHNNSAYELLPLELFNGNSFNVIPWNHDLDNQIVVSQNVEHTTLMKGYGYGLIKAPCCTQAAAVGVPSKTFVGISSLDRKQDWLGNDEENQLGAYIALESSNSAFVITRNADPATNISNPVEGMLVWDTTDNCLKLYKGEAIGWTCTSNQCEQ